MKFFHILTTYICTTPHCWLHEWNLFGEPGPDKTFALPSHFHIFIITLSSFSFNYALTNLLLEQNILDFLNPDLKSL